MANRDAAERACKDPNPIIDGRKANVNLAYLGAKPRGILTGVSEWHIFLHSLIPMFNFQLKTKMCLEKEECCYANCDVILNKMA